MTSNDWIIETYPSTYPPFLFLCSSSLMAMRPSLPSTPSGPSTRTAMAQSTSESSSAHCPSHHGAVSSRSLTGLSTCTTWMETAKSHGWRCWRSSRYKLSEGVWFFLLGQPYTSFVTCWVTRTTIFVLWLLSAELRLSSLRQAVQTICS